MEKEKEIILYHIQQNSWVVKPVKWRLIMDLEDGYGIPPATSERIIRELARDLLITIHNDKCDITQKGINWLNNKGDVDAFMAALELGEGGSKKKEKGTVRKAIELVAWLATIIGTVILIYQVVTKK